MNIVVLFARNQSLIVFIQGKHEKRRRRIEFKRGYQTGEENKINEKKQTFFLQAKNTKNFEDWLTWLRLGKKEED